MKAQQLKNSILQMAVQGKLVPQDPDDEPARVLLERIRAEKAKLIKEGKIKKEKAPSYIFRGEDNLPYEKIGDNEPICIADEVPFEIPESWEWVRLGTVCQLTDGTKSDKKHLPIMDAKFLRGKSEITYSNNGKFASKGTRLILVDGENSGEVFLAPTDGYMGSTFKILWLSSELNETYTLKFIEIYRNLLKNSKKGAAIPHLNKELFFSLFLPLPPHAEQKRIVKALEALQPYINEYETKETALTKLNADFPDLLKKSILQQAVMGKLVPQDENDEPACVLLERIRDEKEALIKAGKLKKSKHESIIYRRDNSHYEKIDGVERCIDDEIPFEIPESWEWVRLQNFVYLTSGSQHLESKDGCLYVKVADMNILGNEDEIITSSHKTKDCINGDIPIRSIIFPKRGGAIATNKRRKVIHESICIDSNTMAMTVIFGKCYEYLYIWFLTVDLGKLQSGSSVPQINNKDLEPLLIPIPPLAEQKRIVAKIEELLKACKMLFTLWTNP